jgi:hypothetical protein
MQMKEELERKLRRSFRKTDGQSWLLDDPHGGGYAKGERREGKGRKKEQLVSNVKQEC